jgi:broad specificity phosphatase PhoE
MTEQPGLFWAQTLLENAGRAQAATTADALRRVNAPMIEALQRQREAAESLAALAEQMSAMAELVARAARQQEELTRQLQAALQPYEAYQEWLDRTGTGGR